MTVVWGDISASARFPHISGPISYKLAWPRTAFFCHLFFNIKTYFAPKNGWGMLVYAPGWSLASQF